ncbi:MAG: aminomethyl-transferring glycine dehydrogenase subunit GcvPA [Thermoleophilia bacterium]|nr:aminomethyl-transferring glycine dehydrogenase subunit GcvPA [Thermoleophilia bacterium]
MPYAPATDDDLRHMLAAIGVDSVDELFADVPEAARMRGELDLPLGVGEAALVARARAHADRTLDLSRTPSFLGVGCYDHYVPAVVRAVVSRSEFATAYTPYQPEVSQGTLQAIFEFQSCIAALTGLPVANASLYDGATAVAEATYLAEQSTHRTRVVVLDTVSPQVRDVLATYASAYGMVVETVAHEPGLGTVDPQRVLDALGDDVAALVVQQPNAFGLLEDAPRLVADAEAAGAVPIVSADPISLGVLEAPGRYGAGVVVGDGQPLGCAPSAGGPAYGFMAAQERYLRRMPGRIVGETLDADGARGYVLTLQTREQHIRRERATSNICTNQALCALAGLVHMGWLGPRGLEQLGAIQFERAGATRRRVLDIAGVTSPHGAGPAFREFLVELPVPAEAVVEAAAAHGMLVGWPAARGWPALPAGALLVAATEQRTDDDIEALAAELERCIAEVAP